MEPNRQLEIQLGHLCNNRCVFCVSGQRTAMGEAKPLAPEPVVERLEQGFAAGHRKVTLLGGEPTLQPSFLPVVRAAVRIGYEEIVIFTNGVRTANGRLIEEVLETGGNFHWRLSFQGATEAAHVRTTGKPQSFRRLHRTLEQLSSRGEAISVNMCVVASNADSVGEFPALLKVHGVGQLHLDLMRPLDAGERSEAELREMMPSYRDFVPAFRTMIQGFEAELPGFDVNIGNLPFCFAPDLAPWIHHDGNRTETVAIDGDDRLSQPWNKYLVKRRDKLKPASCETCLMHADCSGVFETYARFHGVGELVPIDELALANADPKRRLLTRHLRPLARRLRQEGWRTEERGERLLRVLGERSVFELVRAADVATVHAIAGRFAIVVREDDAEERKRLVEVLAAEEWKMPLPEGALFPAQELRRGFEKLAGALMASPLAWSRTEIAEQRIDAEVQASDGGRAIVFLQAEGDRKRSGYELLGEPTEGLRRELAELWSQLRGR